MCGVLASGRYESEELRILRRTLDPGDRVLELGTGLGLLAIHCARKVGSERVFSVEANPALEPLVRRNFALNEVSPELEIAVLGAEEGQRRLHVPVDFWASSLVHHGQWRGAPWHLRRGTRVVEVPARPLHDKLAEASPNYLVVDIEGGEGELAEVWHLEGIEKLLIEVHPAAIGKGAVARVVRSIEAQGLRLWEQLSGPLTRFYGR